MWNEPYGTALAVVGGLGFALFIASTVRRFGWSDWRSYAPLVSLLLALSRIAGISGVLYVVLVALALGLLLPALVALGRDVSKPGVAPTTGNKPEYELRYAFESGKAAWSWQSKVTLWMENPPLPGALVGPPTNPGGLMALIAAGGPGAKATPPSGTRISGLWQYRVALWNTGARPLPDLPLRIELEWSGTAPTTIHGGPAEKIVWVPSVTAPGGAAVQLAVDGATALVALCDLFNPDERIEFTFHTVIDGWALGADASVVVHARAPGLPPPIRCNWDGQKVPPALPELDHYELRARFWPLPLLGRGLRRLGRALVAAGGRMALKRVPRAQRAAR